MTCIAGAVQIEDDGTRRVVLAADSAVVSGWDVSLHVPETAKLFAVGPLVIGSSGAARLSQVLRHALVVPFHPAEQSAIAWLAIDLAAAVRAVAETYECLEDDPDRKGSRRMAGVLILAYRGHLYTMAKDGCVSERPEPWDVLGGGEDIALGVLAATVTTPCGRDPSAWTVHRVRQAVSIAARYKMGVAEPLTVMQQVWEPGQ